MIHELKCWPEFFDAIECGEKTFEVRRDDRGFRVGDTLRLRRFQPDPDATYNGGSWVDREGKDVGVHDCARMDLLVTYKLPGGRFGIDQNWCVLGFAYEKLNGFGVRDLCRELLRVRDSVLPMDLDDGSRWVVSSIDGGGWPPKRVALCREIEGKATDRRIYRIEE